jgi:O-antigen/teichoic acid export membrane protein
VLLSTLPGQLSFRFQIIVCAVVLGDGATALFLYGRQIAAAASQVLEFVRRAHFPAMVQDLRIGGLSISRVLRTQKLATGLALLAACGLFCAGLLCFLLLDGSFAQSGLIVSLFSFGVLTGALSQTLAQAAQGVGHYSVVASAAVLAMLAGFPASAGLGLLFGLSGLAVAEVLTHGAGALLIYVGVFRRSPDRAIAQGAA